MKALVLALAVLAAGSALAGADAFSDATKQQTEKFHKTSGSASQTTPGAKPVGKLDLSGLVGGPSPTPDAPAAVEGPDSPKPGFLAAVDYIAGDGLETSKAAFAQYLERRASAGGVEGPQDADFRNARAMIDALARAQPDAASHLAIKSMSARDGDVGSAYWQVEIKEGKFAGGEVGLAARPRDKIGASGPGDLNYQRLKYLDNWANSVMHEALHVYYSAFIALGFTAKQTADKWPICFGQTVFAMGARPGIVCAPGRACPQTYKSYADPRSTAGASAGGTPECYRACGDPQACYSWAIPGKDAEGPTEIIARKASLDMTESSRGEALKKILDAGR